MKMKCLLLIMFVFAMYENDSDTKSVEKNEAEQPTVVKIEEDEYVKENKKTSTYFGVSYNKNKAKWRAYRRSKNEKKNVFNGTYKNEETAAHASDTLARKLIANGEKGHKLNFPDDDTEMYPEQKTNYFGVFYNAINATWYVSRWSKNEKKIVTNGTYKNEETAAHASDTLARKLIVSGEKGHKLNFPDDDTEVYPEEVVHAFSSNYFGVYYNNRAARWHAYRHSKHEKKIVTNGRYKDEETAAHASDTLARKLIKNGEKSHTLNFPEDETEVRPEELKCSSNYFGVFYNKRDARWYASRWSKNERKIVINRAYKDEETAAHASDTLTRQLMANGEKRHKLNFPDDDTEMSTEKATYQRQKRKRRNNLENSQENKSYQFSKK